MAGGFESPEGEKFLRPDGSKRQSRAVQNLIQNRTKYEGPSQMENFFVPQSFLCPAEMKEMAERLSHHRWQVDSSRLKARNYSKFNSKLFKGPAGYRGLSEESGLGRGQI